jgi:chemotaxis protein CheZ
MNEATPLDKDQAFGRLGTITRQLHQAMNELGFDVQLQRIAHEIPDARDRLSYVGQMTESAAHRVLGLVEEAKPTCTHLAEHAQGSQRNLDRLIEDGHTAAPQLREGLEQVKAFVTAAGAHAEKQERTLTEIMMAQDFQDLSGQVIKKVIDIISRTEGQLLQLLKESAPEHVMAAVAAANAGPLQGPQMPDKALKQDDVDDLLASMGF